MPAMTGCYDSDHHCVDTLEALPGHMDPAYRERGWRVVERSDGLRVLGVGDQSSRLDCDHAPVPGSFRDTILRLRGGEDLDPFVGQVGPVRPDFVDRDERLAFMDREGIEGVLLFPGTPLETHWMLEDDDPKQVAANLRAVNRFMAEQWGWSYRDRIHSVALLDLSNLELALEELDRVMAEGCKVVNLVPGPVGGRSPADPYFDPFWSRIDESKLLVSLHTGGASHPPYRQMLDGFWEPADPPGVERGINDITSAFMGCQMFNERPIMDTISALILHNLFGRFPNTRVISVENGAFWVTFAVKLMNKNFAITQNGYWLGGKPGRPSEVFREFISVTPFHEDDVQQLVDVVGPRAVTFGSDYPHAEGLASPINDFLEDLEVRDEQVIDRIMRSNLKELLGRVGT